MDAVLKSLLASIRTAPADLCRVEELVAALTDRLIEVEAADRLRAVGELAQAMRDREMLARGIAQGLAEARGRLERVEDLGGAGDEESVRIRARARLYLALEEMLEDGRWYAVRVEDYHSLYHGPRLRLRVVPLDGRPVKEPGAGSG